MRKSAGSTKEEADSIEAEYIKNLQQQIYFLELETNYLYPCTMHNILSKMCFVENVVTLKIFTAKF